MAMSYTTLHYFAVSCALLVASVSSLPPPAVFQVGDERGWTVPANGTETYNHWAKRNRFQVGDVLDFKYGANDSVLLVAHDDYKQCSTETPLGRFTGGDTKFALDRYGPVYFVSGVAGHCEAGQRMIVRVIRPGASAPRGAPVAAPAMPPTASGSGRSGAPSPATSPAGSGSGSSSTSPSPSPSPSPLPQASGASRRVLVSSVAVGLVLLVACAITLSSVVA
ncbi:uclacyanin-2 precursor [Zea mays]|uniref:uclacyanin-2 precursor n=1 Tax=Zea mays TaxID=4577 RepID=UPI000F7D0735|nr:uclacyanin-2 precursor [Zea mays]